MLQLKSRTSKTLQYTAKVSCDPKCRYNLKCFPNNLEAFFPRIIFCDQCTRRHTLQNAIQGFLKWILSSTPSQPLLHQEIYLIQSTYSRFLTQELYSSFIPYFVSSLQCKFQAISCLKSHSFSQYPNYRIQKFLKKPKAFAQSSPSSSFNLYLRPVHMLKA